jgi:hypothetical protein
MKRYVSHACTRCGCCAEGVHTTNTEGQRYIKWDPPPPNCACVCHDAWRFVHRAPAEVAA